MTLANFRKLMATVRRGVARRAGGCLARVVPAIGNRRGYVAARSDFALPGDGAVEPFALSDIPVPANDVMLARQGSGGFLKYRAGRHALHLNNTALGLWRLCGGNRSVGEIAAILAWRFPDDEQRVRKDVARALQEFEARGLVTRTRHGTVARPPKKTAAPVRHKVFGIGWTFGPQRSSNSIRKPKHFDWTDDRNEATIPLTVCIGHGIKSGLELPGAKIAWLIESPAISRWQRLDEFVMANLDRVLEAYEVILSPDRAFCELDPKIRYHPAGSNLPWIAEASYRIYPKSRLCSMFASPKLMVEGHHIRHEYARRFKDRLDLFGGACGSPRIGEDAAHPDKSEGLAPYMFSIAMENCRVSLYYTEKITDCFATGTVPVYWGSEDIGEIFDDNGIIKLEENLDIGMLNTDLYMDMMPYIKNNFEITKSLSGSDDQLFEKYIKT